MVESRSSIGPMRPVTPTQHASSTNSQFLAAPGQKPLSIPMPNQRPLSSVGPLSPVNQNGSFAFDRVIKCGKVERRVKKKGAWKASWKQAYLVLRPNLLSVYKDENETELRASITLSEVTAVAPVKKSHHDNVFGIFSPSKNYHFAGLTARETTDWITIIRIEAHTEVEEDQEELKPPNAGFTQNEHYETTDASADEDVEVPGSPTTPRWSIQASKRTQPPTASLDPRRASGNLYSGNETFSTSQSDFSDGLGTSAPGSKGLLSSSMPPILTPIPDESNSKNQLDAGPSPPSDPVQPLSQSAPKALPLTNNTNNTTNNTSDANRIVRQGPVRLSKTTSGVKQWKSIFLVLRINALQFFKHANDAAPLLVIPMQRIIDAAEVERKKQHCFQVISEEKTYRFQAESENDLETWLGALMSVLSRQSGSRHASVSTKAPPSREEMGVSNMTGQLRTVSLETHGTAGTPASRRVVSPQGGHAQSPL